MHNIGDFRKSESWDFLGLLATEDSSVKRVVLGRAVLVRPLGVGYVDVVLGHWVLGYWVLGTGLQAELGALISSEM